MSKPGESNYSIYRRFLISNKLIINDLKNLECKLKVYFKSNFGEEAEYPGIPGSIKMLEGKTFNQEIIISKAVAHRVTFCSKPIKSCHKCSRIGYHSYFFELDWISRCPIHNSVLLKRCPICHKSWPQYNDLPKRNCSCCGVAVVVRKIAKEIIIETQTYKLIEKYLGHISRQEELDKSILTYDGSKKVKLISNINSLSAFTVNALFEFGFLDSGGFSDCNKLINTKFKPFVESFSFNQLPKNKVNKFTTGLMDNKNYFIKKFTPEFQDNINIIKHRITIKFYHLISRLGQWGCHSPYDPCKIKSCKTCRLWYHWLESVFPEVNYSQYIHKSKTQDITLNLPELVTILLSCDKNIYTSFSMYQGSNRKLQETKQQINEGKIRVYEISELLTTKLFEIELWLRANLLLKSYLETHVNVLQMDLMKDYINDEVVTDRYHNNYSIHSLYFEFGTSNIKLIYPNNLLSDDILTSYSLRKLLEKITC